MKAYKGFNADMTCRGFKYEEGKSYETDKAKLCERGFHACKNPLDCFDFYEPNSSVYHEVELDGEIDDKNETVTKVAATKIKIGARLSIAGLVKAAIDFTMSHIKPEAKADENFGAASATGYSGAASAGHETSVAVAWGPFGLAKGVKGSHIVLADWREENNGELKLHGAKCVRIDGKKYKADTWYTMKNGKIVEVDGGAW